MLADALAAHVRDVAGSDDDFAGSQAHRSPWPFRVNARTGVVIDDYCANVIEPIRLFDELLRRPDRLALTARQVAAYQRARKLAWDWLVSKNGPLVTYVWNGYFEDVPSDPQLANRVQITPLETARYILKREPRDLDVTRQAEALTTWVRAVFGEPGEPSINEQSWCRVPMGSHTARYASVEALLFERTGDPRFKEEAYRHFNWATYCTQPNGVVSVGPRWTGTWWSDGYGDYIRHFFEGLAAVPEWAPANENHLLRSSSVVQQIHYDDDAISYRTFDAAGTEEFRLTRRPAHVRAAGRELSSTTVAGSDGWTWEPLRPGGGVLRIRRSAAPTVTVEIP